RRSGAGDVPGPLRQGGQLPELVVLGAHDEIPPLLVHGRRRPAAGFENTVEVGRPDGPIRKPADVPPGSDGVPRVHGRHSTRAKGSPPSGCRSRLGWGVTDRGVARIRQCHGTAPNVNSDTVDGWDG